jgi:hypothetical protein
MKGTFIQKGVDSFPDIQAAGGPMTGQIFRASHLFDQGFSEP